MPDFALTTCPANRAVGCRQGSSTAYIIPRQTVASRLRSSQPEASIVLQCAAGYTNRDLAQDLDISERTVSKWRGRFVARRLDGLHDLPRPGLPRSVTEDQVDS